MFKLVVASSLVLLACAAPADLPPVAHLTIALPSGAAPAPGAPAPPTQDQIASFKALAAAMKDPNATRDSRKAAFTKFLADNNETAHYEELLKEIRDKVNDGKTLTPGAATFAKLILSQYDNGDFYDAPETVKALIKKDLETNPLSAEDKASLKALGEQYKSQFQGFASMFPHPHGADGTATDANGAPAHFEAIANLKDQIHI